MSKLNVPLMSQTDSFSCVPACLKMVLDYLYTIIAQGQTLNDSNKVGIEEIAKSVKTTLAGTALENIKNLNRNEKILKTIPSIEFEDKTMCTLSEIETEINESRPIITWILLEFPPKKFIHSVVITGLDMEKQKIYYTDPIFGEKEEFVGKFMQMWENIDRIAIKVKIGKKEQKLLDTWIQVTEGQGRLNS